jgi:formylglycine-generating enzyme required for sulfatase activity
MRTRCRWLRALFPALVAALNVAAQTEPVRLAPVAPPSATNAPAAGTNHLAIVSPLTPPWYRGAIYTWPATPPQPGAAGASAAKLPMQYWMTSAPPPRGMRPIPAEAFNSLAGLASSNSGFAGFYLDAFEVTRHLWNSVVRRAGACGYDDLSAVATNRDDLDLSIHPVVNVSWYDCIKWCNARSEIEGVVPVYYADASQRRVYRAGILSESSLTVAAGANGYRLPTSLEWEAGARGGRPGGLYPWGADFLSGEKANYWASGDPFDNGTTPIGYYDGRQVTAGAKTGLSMASRYGLFDMAGNVAEWCADSVPTARGAAPSSQRVVRGGSWRSRDESLLLCGYRGFASPMLQADHLGFRTARTR